MNEKFQYAVQEITRRVEGLPLDETQRVPAGGGWSRQEVLAHLVLAHRATGQELERRIANGEPTKRKRSLRDRAAQFTLITLGYFPPGRKAPETVRPEKMDWPAMEGSGLAEAYRTAMAGLADSIGRAREKFGAHMAVAVHPVLGPLNAPQWEAFHAIHALHHAKQLDRIARSGPS